VKDKLTIYVGEEMAKAASDKLAGSISAICQDALAKALGWEPRNRNRLKGKVQDLREKLAEAETDLEVLDRALS